MIYMINENPALIRKAIQENDYTEQLLGEGAYGKVYIITFSDDSQVVMKIQNKVISKHINQEISILKIDQRSLS